MSAALISWRHRLTTKLFAATCALAVAAVGVFTFTESRFQQTLLDQTTSGTDLFSHTIERAIDMAMLEDRREDAQETMKAISLQPAVERVRMLDAHGKTKFSSLPGEVGTTLGKDAGPCQFCHQAGQPAVHVATWQRTRIFETTEHHRAIGLSRPIYNESRCSSSACHEHKEGQQVLGVLDVAVSLEDVDSRIDGFRQVGVIFTAALVLVLGFFFFALARQHVVRPVDALLEGTRRVAADELGVEIHVHTQGELGLLAASFNEMTHSLRRAKDDLRELNRSLEQKVEDRTAELKRAQSTLIQSEKLRSLGQLSASIAHEINNPLAGILTFAKLLIRCAEQDVPDEARRKVLVKNLMLIERETGRCSAIVRNLLDFARERALEQKDVDLNAVVNESLQLIAHQVQLQNGSVVKQLAVLPPVRGDFGQLRQAVVNLLLNAGQAMGTGGQITVTTRVCDGGAWIELIVADNGPGISPENLPRIFDPFFTTKAKGTGLGLSVVYGIVEHHGGTVEAKSELGHGATFITRLPAAKPAGG